MLVLLLALALQAGAADKLAPYRGQPILSVTLDAPQEHDVGALKRLIQIQPGYILYSADIQRAIKRLYSVGNFSNVRVFAKRVKGAIHLHFQLRRRHGQWRGLCNTFYLPMYQIPVHSR